MLGAPAVATADATLHAKVLQKVFWAVTREVHESGVAFEPRERYKSDYVLFQAGERLLGSLRGTTDFPLFVAFKLGATDLTLKHFVQSWGQEVRRRNISVISPNPPCMQRAELAAHGNFPTHPARQIAAATPGCIPVQHVVCWQQTPT